MGLGWIGGLLVSIDTITGADACPEIGFVPACYVVLLGYSLMLVSAALPRWRWGKWLFVSGATPVALLAVFGSVSELLVGETCPRSESGVPLCYVSLALVAVIVALYWRCSRKSSFSNARLFQGVNPPFRSWVRR